MPLSATVEARFGENSFSLSGSVAGLTTLLGDVSIPGVDLDVGAALAVAERLASADTSGPFDAAGSIAELVGGLVAEFPDLGGIMGPLLDAAAALGSLTGGGLATAFDLAPVTAELGLGGLQASIGSVGTVLENPAIGGVLDLIGRVLPGFDLGSPGALLGGPAGGLVSLVQLVGGLMAVDTISADIERKAALVARVLDAPRLAALVVQLRTVTGPGLPDLLTGIDPDDLLSVEVVLPAVAAYTDALHELADVVVRGLAFGEATLVHADLPGAAAQLQLATLLLAESALPQVGVLARAAAGWIAPVLALPVPAPPGPGAVVDRLSAIAAPLVDAAAALDPATLARPITRLLDTVLAPVELLERAAVEVTTAAQAAFSTVRTALDAIDLTAVQDALRQLLEPVAEAVATLGDVIGVAQGAIQTAGQAAIDDVITPVQAALSGVAAAIHTALDGVATLLRELGLADLQQTLTTGVGAVADALRAAQLAPAFDVSSGIIDTAADLLGAVPKALLPDDLKAELEAACAPVEALDLEPVRTELHATLQQIRDGIDVEVLTAVAEAQAAVVEFLRSVDPRPPLEEFEAGPFQDLVDQLRAIDPTVALAEVFEPLERVKEAVAGFDPAAVLQPVEDALDEVTAAIASFDPAALLAPVTQAVDDFRTWVTDTLHLDDLGAILDDVDAAIDRWLALLDPARVVAALDQGWDSLTAELSAGAAVNDPVGPLVAALTEGGRFDVRPASFTEVVAWIRGRRDGATVVRARLTRASDTLAATLAALAAVDLRAVVPQLEADHRRIVAALEAHPPGSRLRVSVGASVSGASPAATLGPAVEHRDRYVARLDADTTVARALASSARGEVTAIARGIATELTPLAPVPAKLHEVVALFGADPTGPGGLAGAARQLLDTFRPSVLLVPLVDAVLALRDALGRLAHEGVVAPLRGAVDQVTDAIDAIDLGFVADELAGLRDEVVGMVDAIRPTTVLAEVLTALDQAKAALAIFDPLGPAKDVVEAMHNAVDVLARDFAPTTLLGPALVLYDEVIGVIEGLNVATILQPVLDALDGLKGQLDTGMDQVIDALAHLKEACESDGGMIPGLDVAIDVDVDVGGLF